MAPRVVFKQNGDQTSAVAHCNWLNNKKRMIFPSFLYVFFPLGAIFKIIYWKFKITCFGSTAILKIAPDYQIYAIPYVWCEGSMLLTWPEDIIVALRRLHTSDWRSIESYFAESKVSNCWFSLHYWCKHKQNFKWKNCIKEYVYKDCIILSKG